MVSLPAPCPPFALPRVQEPRAVHGEASEDSVGVLGCTASVTEAPALAGAGVLVATSSSTSANRCCSPGTRSACSCTICLSSCNSDASLGFAVAVSRSRVFARLLTESALPPWYFSGVAHQGLPELWKQNRRGVEREAQREHHQEGHAKIHLPEQVQIEDRSALSACLP
jgi:hypothetical protein